MKSIEQRILEDYILGCMKYENNYNFYLMPIAWWILNYIKYSPSILEDNERRKNFRNGVLIVTNENHKDFFASIEEDKIMENELLEIIRNISPKYSEEGYSYLTFYIDFDNNEYINGFYDIELENYLPDNTWKGKFDEPLKYLPKELQEYWD
jgi:uncharacterized protein YpiB (UPF0302 family)